MVLCTYNIHRSKPGPVERVHTWHHTEVIIIWAKICWGSILRRGVKVVPCTDIDYATDQVKVTFPITDWDGTLRRFN